MPADFEIHEASAEILPEYSAIQIAFRVESILIPRPSGGLEERRVETPWTKDYDRLEDPLAWPRRFDVSRWRFFVARGAVKLLGGAVANGCTLHDIRIRPEVRGQGIGTALFHAAAEWMSLRECPYLEVETQNVNVAACRFYERQGCELMTVVRHAYPDLPDEIQLIWRYSFPS